ncbi:MAG: 2-C-methyl-D-erythritol 2,4-cyclodiphosphate synthase [SAR202 cluster bacterium]|nr:2-C-methyl-D-erythritol 2,4-cyclodiphosphate synthase [Chloroflexota bacterium]MQG51613.1 2-C-methyl-D-erythritol 2,4-cyclodiphosphate synthase [SAR202 cluster bacterium]
MRVGTGFDVHNLNNNRKLILGGVEIPFGKGLEGHSDGDVVIHAIIDSLLGASGLGDIGQYFPSSDMKYKDINSISLLESTLEIINAAGWSIGNIDVTIIAQEPKLSTFIELIKTSLSTALNIKSNLINIKATTTDGLGFIGQGKGIACQSVALIE